MSLLSFLQLRALQNEGVIQNSLPEHLNATSIDITLGGEILSEAIPNNFSESVVALSERKPLKMKSWPIGDGYLLQPRECILAHSEQVFNLPDFISAEYKLKSSMARIFLEHLNAGWCDAGWNGSVLTLELCNMSLYHSIVLRRGDRIGQVVFFAHAQVPSEASYSNKGRYNNDRKVTAIKP